MKNKIIYFTPIVFALLVSISCHNQDWILYRASSDYFPLRNGDWWKYETQNITKLVEVQGDTFVNNQPCIHLFNAYEDEYWTDDNGNMRKLNLRTVNYGGTDYVLENEWLLQYKLPFVLGSLWSDVFTDTVVILGDSYRLKHNIIRKVVQIEDLNIPAGTFFQAYKIEYNETFTFNDSIENYSGFEWFAPGVGLIKKVINNSETILTDYSVK